MERRSPHTEYRQKEYFSRACGVMTTFAIMKTLGDKPFVHREGTLYDQEFLRLGNLLALEKDETFLDDIYAVEYESSEETEIRRRILYELNLLKPNTYELLDNNLIPNALDYHRGYMPAQQVGIDMVALCKNHCIPFYTKRAEDNLQLSLESTSHSSGNGLGIVHRTGVAALDAAFYTSEYYQETPHHG